MFGYVKICKEELKIKDWNRYRAYYCALCREIGSYSQLHRLLLSYDMTFFAILAGCDFDAGFSCKNRTHPKCHGSIGCFSKCFGDSNLRFLSAFSIILQYQKIIDDVIDGDKRKRLFVPLLKKGYTKAKNTYPEAAKIVEQQLQRLRALELNNCTNLSQLQECFACIFREVLSCLPDKSEDEKSILGEIAYHVAAWVYLVDMYDDQEKDKAEKSFNPLLQMSMCTSQINTDEVILDLLIDHIEQAKAQLRVLPYNDGTAILENIICWGLPAQMQKVGLIE